MLVKKYLKLYKKIPENVSSISAEGNVEPQFRTTAKSQLWILRQILTYTILSNLVNNLYTDYIVLYRMTAIHNVSLRFSYLQLSLVGCQKLTTRTKYFR